MLVPPLCWSCRGVARRGEPLCRGCHGALQRLPSEPVLLEGVPVWAPLAYEGGARDLVRALKFRGAVAVADTMAAQITANGPAGWLGAGPGAAPALVPVPLHPRRLRRRGYNQAGLLAGSLARRIGAEPAEVLRRAGAATTQVGRGRGERRGGPAGSFAVAAGILPEQALLVDDVVTTGATLAACAAALRAGGVGEVRAVAFARTLGR